MMEPIPKPFKRWLVAAVVILVGGLVVLAVDVTAAFVLYADKSIPLWIALVGIAAAMSVALGFATMLGLMVVATVRSNREARRVQVISPEHKA